MKMRVVVTVCVGVRFAMNIVAWAGIDHNVQFLRNCCHSVEGLERKEFTLKLFGQSCQDIPVKDLIGFQSDKRSSPMMLSLLRENTELVSFQRPGLQ